MKTIAIVAALAAYASCLAPAQTPAPAQTKFKAIWEPANFNKDIELNSAAFPSAEQGWIVGEKNTILHTKDGGKTWEVQLGGDPASADRPLQDVFFLDDKHGWARGSAEQMLQTTDGATWQEVGKFSGHWIHPQFVSPATGLAVTGDVAGGIIQRTDDGGKNWKPVFKCGMELQVEGLARQLPCAFRSLSFGDSRGGYAAAYFPLSGVRATAIVRTNDAGNTWTVSKPEGMDAEPEQIYFWNATTGIVVLRDRKSLMTTDGGASWKGIVAPFPDPRVHLAMGGGRFGVGLLYKMAYYSTNGGRSFSSRPFPVPANPNAVTFPDASHGYTVGPHGMVYRYRIVPLDYNVPGMIGAPAVE